MKRRHFLKGTVALAVARIAHAAPAPAEDELSFFLVGDTHYRADENKPETMDERSSSICFRLVDWLNKLPGTPFPATAGGGVVGVPQGVIHAGDLIDSGDKNGRKFDAMQRTELAAFLADWGLEGGDGKLRWPVREIHGNHDSPHGEGIVIPEIMARNKRRKALAGVSANGLHYSWDWHGVHFINLGLIVGETPAVKRKRRYGSLESLDFLISDLAARVGPSGRPVIVTHHVDVGRYSAEVPDDKVLGNEWDYADVRGFHDALKPYHVIAILHGHTHVRDVFRWDGRKKLSAGGDAGIPVFNTDNASHFGGDTQAFLHFTLSSQGMTVREFATRDRWVTGDWNGNMWRFPRSA
jgi:cytolysin (calcineurin-like family phosphatase)